MNTLQDKIEQIKKLMNRVISELDTLTFETFDMVFPSALSTMKRVHEIHESLVLEYGSGGKKIFEEELMDSAKQIESKFDNIVEIFTAEENRMAKELLSVAKKKKLTAYKG